MILLLQFMKARTFKREKQLQNGYFLEEKLTLIKQRYNPITKKYKLVFEKVKTLIYKNIKTVIAIVVLTFFSYFGFNYLNDYVSNWDTSIPIHHIRGGSGANSPGNPGARAKSTARSPKSGSSTIFAEAFSNPKAFNSRPGITSHNPTAYKWRPTINSDYIPGKPGPKSITVYKNGKLVSTNLKADQANASNNAKLESGNLNLNKDAKSQKLKIVKTLKTNIDKDGVLTKKSSSHITSKHGHQLGVDDRLPPNASDQNSKYPKIYTRTNKETETVVGNTIQTILLDKQTVFYSKVNIKGQDGVCWYNPRNDFAISSEYADNGVIVGGFNSSDTGEIVVTIGHSANERQVENLLSDGPYKLY